MARLYMSAVMEDAGVHRVLAVNECRRQPARMFAPANPNANAVSKIKNEKFLPHSSPI